MFYLFLFMSLVYITHLFFPVFFALYKAKSASSIAFCICFSLLKIDIPAEKLNDGTIFKLLNCLFNLSIFFLIKFTSLESNIIKNSHIVFKYFSFVNVNKISVNLRGISKGTLTLKINNKTIDKIDIHPSLSWEKYDFVLNNLTSGKASIEFEFNSKKSIDFLNFEIN